MDYDDILTKGVDAGPAIRFLAKKVQALENQVASANMMVPAEAGGNMRDRTDLRQWLPDRTAAALAKAGLRSVSAVAAATDERLLEVDGIGPATLREIRQAIPALG